MQLCVEVRLLCYGRHCWRQRVHGNSSHGHSTWWAKKATEYCMYVSTSIYKKSWQKTSVQQVVADYKPDGRLPCTKAMLNEAVIEIWAESQIYFWISRQIWNFKWTQCKLYLLFSAIKFSGTSRLPYSGQNIYSSQINRRSPEYFPVYF